MTTIRILRKNKIIYGFESFGHTDFGKSGSDILCAAVSSVLQAGANGLVKVVGLKDYVLSQNEDEPSLKFLVKSYSDDNEQNEAQILFKTILESMKELERDYKKYIKLEANYEI